MGEITFIFLQFCVDAETYPEDHSDTTMTGVPLQRGAATIKYCFCLQIFLAALNTTNTTLCMIGHACVLDSMLALESLC